ncbi:MAG: NAD(P)/FAD-dependent oxidoreductase [Lachnospiraceae bacterium]|nr:NAD(P)/FAD-dependent oxidoreductase [Lachnospiraceae bacterium]
MSRIMVIGGGAAGMIAAVFSARNGHEVHIFEKNEKLGKKVYITGKGRCNITNACDPSDFIKNIVRNPKFMYSALGSFSNADTMDFFESLGLEIKTERGQRVFPVSDHSSDVIKALERELIRLNVRIHYNSKVNSLIVEDGVLKGLIFNERDKFFGDACIVATGGLSYPSTGSTGDGYRFAKDCGHSVTKLSPSLVAIVTEETFPKDLQGLSLKNVNIRLTKDKKVLYTETGEMLFTHFGISGPLVLSASSYIAEEVLKGGEMPLIHLDLKPGLNEEMLEGRIIRDFSENPKKEFKNSLDKLLPKSMTGTLVELSGIEPQKQVGNISKKEIKTLVHTFKDVEFHPVKLRDYPEAIITKGGVCVNEISPKTMESKLVKGLFFAGEVLDVDALTGGFNLQIAWSSGYMAGNAI